MSSNASLGFEVSRLRPDQRIVVATPLLDLWDERGPLEAERVGDLSVHEIAERLRPGPVAFVVAEVGRPPRWIAARETFEFWTREVRPRVAHPNGRARLDDFPDGRAYFASEWSSATRGTIVLLETTH